MFGRDPVPPTDPTPALLGATCFECGYAGTNPDARFCRRCGAAVVAGLKPSQLPECPECYQRPDAAGTFPSVIRSWRRVPFAEHRAEHETYPVGDDEWLESLRDLDEICIGPWRAPFNLVRRYLVTGMVDAGRRRSFQHNALITAMLQLKAGSASWAIGDQESWRQARSEIESLMQRYHRVRRMPIG